jgi:hypothetical protein
MIDAIVFLGFIAFCVLLLKAITMIGFPFD